MTFLARVISLPLFYVGYQARGPFRDISHIPKIATTLFEGSDHISDGEAMSSSCIEEVSIPDNHWYRIATELLSRAGIAVNGAAPSDIQVKNPDFLNGCYRKVPSVLAKAIWMAGGSASGSISFSLKCCARGWKSNCHVT